MQSEGLNIIMNDQVKVFESMPVPKAVASLVMPTILSQFVTMIYNLADTFFVGQTGNSNMVAGISVVYPLVFVMNAIACLFGIGGSSLISRLLGAKQRKNAMEVSSFCVYTSMLVSMVYSLFVFFNMNYLLDILGASPNTFMYARDYLIWVIVIGCIPTTVGLVLVHLLRSEGYAKKASIGIALGGILNIILDPIFIFPLDMGIKGAAIATMLSNTVALIYYLIILSGIKSKTVLSIKLSDFSCKKKMVAEIFSVGLPAATVNLLGTLCNVVINVVISAYGDIQIAAWGVVRKINMLSTNFGMGLSQGILPLVAYNYAAKNYSRMKSIISFTRIIGIIFSIIVIVIFTLQDLCS